MLQPVEGHEPCELCGGSDFEVVAERLRFDIERRVLRCRSCTLVSLEHPRAAGIEYSPETYDRLYTPVLGQPTTGAQLFELYRPQQEDRAGRIADLLTSSTTVLELGCSSGYFLDAVRDRVAAVAGIELNDARAAHARELGIEVHGEPLEDGPFAGRRFDLIVGFQVFEHLPDPLGMLRACADHLTPGGHVVFEVPNVDEALLSVYGVDEFAARYWREPHVYYYSARTIAAMFERAGFRAEVRQSQTYSLFNHVHWMLDRSPQPSVVDATSTPPVPGPGTSPEVTDRIRTWLERADVEYRRMLEDEGVAQNLLAIGTPAA